jgi:hypothetical protein
MGATSAQGWYLFTFIVGFTLGPAGLAGLGWIVALAGFYRIKEPTSQAQKTETAQLGQQRAVKSY